MKIDRQEFKTTFAGQEVVLTTSGLAGQANAAVFGRHGDTEVLATVVMGREDRAVDFFPLTVDYEERFYAAGKILGSRYMRREGRPSEEAILAGRIIDRTIRPLFDHRIRRDVHVVVTVLSVDEKNDVNFIALLATSAALAISDIPWSGPVAGVKVTIGKDGKFVFNPVNGEATNTHPKLTSFVAGTADRINMIEMEGVESSESETAEAFIAAHNEIKKLVVWQNEMIGKIGKKKTKVHLDELPTELRDKARVFLEPKIEKAMYVSDKTERELALAEAHKELDAFLEKELGEASPHHALLIFEEETDGLVHRNVIERNRRPDGRGLDEIRELHGEAGVLARAHGSAIFMRGNTQALAVITLGPPSAEQIVESIGFTGKRKFLLHYNFPKFSVGEAGTSRGPGRREIGHGALASKAIESVLPTSAEFPYTIRIVSEILSSNGSSSMATVCAGILALMDAGVPIKKPVAGIAMGLMTDSKGNHKVLTDIQGPEDHYGDMDFKVAGTKDGITAVQLDVKISGITPEMIKEVLDKAKIAREKILDVMNGVLAKPRAELSPYAPIIITTKIAPEKIGELIGPGGKMINGIIERTGALSIDIEEDGSVFITADKKELAEAALDEVRAIGKVFAIGEVIDNAEVVRILDFGAIVQIDAHHDGMVHVSELKDGFVKSVTDVVKVGDKIRVKIVRIEDGKIGLSMKQAR
ncbi:MAG: polyribonucleotide nucleotidyltransferase [Patescibacteria group bacterium]